MALVILDCEIYLSQGKLDHSCLDVNLLHLDNLHTYVFASFLEMAQIEGHNIKRVPADQRLRETV